MHSAGYAVIITPDTNNTLLVTSEDFPELVTFGDTLKDALTHATAAMEEAIAARMHHKQNIPRPTPQAGLPIVHLSAQTLLKIAVYEAMLEEGISKTEMARRLHVHPPQVDRLLNLRHASRIDRLEQALYTLGRRATVHTAHI